MDFKKAWVSLTATFSLIAFFAIAASAATVTFKPKDALSDIALKYNTASNDIELADEYQTNVDKVFPSQAVKVVQIIELTDEQRQQELAQLMQHAKEVEAKRQEELRRQEEQRQREAELKRQAQMEQQRIKEQQQAEENAKQYVATKESGGSYTATNGIYYGKYQLTISYLKGNLSPTNQEIVAQQYVQTRYGSWQNAKVHWDTHGWF